MKLIGNILIFKLIGNILIFKLALNITIPCYRLKERQKETSRRKEEREYCMVVEGGLFKLLDVEMIQYGKIKRK